MKPLAPTFSVALTVAVGAAWTVLAGPTVVAAESPGPSQPPMPADLMARGSAIMAYPSFCEIPPAPTGQRTAQTYKMLVVETRLAGARLVAHTAPDTFVLGDTDSFAAGARAAATPPPPLSPAGDTDAFLKSARTRALPPGRR
jgi:hypothetical protein